MECNLNSDLFIHQACLDPKLQLVNENLKVKIDFFLDRNDNQINIYQSDFEIASAQFNSSGFVDFSDVGLIDISFEANDKDLSFTRLFLTAEGINNIKQGQLFFKGNILGKITDKLPEIKCSFGANKLKIQMPNSSEYIENIIIDGNFSSGNDPDLSSAILNIDTITAQLPSGYMHGSANIQNLKTPKISYNLDASFKLDGLNQIFEISLFENLAGRVVINDKYHGYYSDSKGWVDTSPENFFLELDSVSFLIPDILNVDMIDGAISGNLDSMRLTDIIIYAQNSDFLINGTLMDISKLVYNKSQPISADLSIKSEYYDFPDFFKSLPEVAKSFPYSISNVSLEVSCETSFDKLTDFNKTPELNFNIDAASGRINSFLPYARLKNGKFNMYEIDSTSVLDFKGFSIEIADAMATADFKLSNSLHDNDSMAITLNTNGINPSKLFYDVKDSVPEIIDAFIQGSFSCFITLPKDTSKLFHSVNLSAGEFHYSGIDTISSSFFDLRATDIAYDKESSLNPMAILSLSGQLDFEQLETSAFQTESLILDIVIDHGKYTLIPDDHQKFGKNEEGLIVMQPFENPPKFHLEYKIQELPLEEFLASFYSEETFIGDVNLEVDLESFGNNMEEITSNMSGNIVLGGDSLTLIGLDLDKLINNFRRSQSFSPADLGALALAGPAGILYTKGSDYAMILTAKKGDSTVISKISSNWILSEGNIAIEDVAFSTLENRVAAKGWLNMKTDSLDVTIAILEPTGCSIIDQRIYGKGEDPQYGKVKVIKTLMSPVTKLLNQIVDKDCKVFYEGIVAHPFSTNKKK